MPWCPDGEWLSLEKSRTQEDRAREIAQRDGVTAGLVCVFSVLEPCQAFDVRGNRETCRKEVVRRQRKCLHFYFYFIDAEFGWMHVATHATCALFAAALAGEHTITGFRNHDLCARLYPPVPPPRRRTPSVAVPGSAG